MYTTLFVTMYPVATESLTKDITLIQYDVYEFIIEGTIYYPTYDGSIN